jgi:hypothetical protein
MSKKVIIEFKLIKSFPDFIDVLNLTATHANDVVIIKGTKNYDDILTKAKNKGIIEKITFQQYYFIDDFKNIVLNDTFEKFKMPKEYFRVYCLGPKYTSRIEITL